MKLFKFFIANERMEIIEGSRGYFDRIENALLPEFSLEDAKTKCPEFFSEAILKRMESLRSETVLKITKLCGWSSRANGPTFLVVKCINDKLDRFIPMRDEFQKVSERLSIVKEEIAKLSDSLMKEKKELEKQKRKLKEEIDYFNKRGNFRDED